LPRKSEILQVDRSITVAVGVTPHSSRDPPERQSGVDMAA
jgi:hypothetical protein